MLSNLLKVTKPVSGKVWVHAQVVWLQGQYSSPACHAALHIRWNVIGVQ